MRTKIVVIEPAHLETFERGIAVIPRGGRQDIEHLVETITRDLGGLLPERILVLLPSVVDRQNDQRGSILGCKFHDCHSAVVVVGNEIDQTIGGGAEHTNFRRGHGGLYRCESWMHSLRKTRQRARPATRTATVANQS
jgi:hypothetical protein